MKQNAVCKTKDHKKTPAAAGAAAGAVAGGVNADVEMEESNAN